MNFQGDLIDNEEEEKRNSCERFKFVSDGDKIHQVTKIGSKPKLLKGAAAKKSTQAHCLPKNQYIEDCEKRKKRYKILKDSLTNTAEEINLQCGKEVVVCITAPYNKYSLNQSFTLNMLGRGAYKMKKKIINAEESDQYDVKLQLNLTPDDLIPGAGDKLMPASWDKDRELQISSESNDLISPTRQRLLVQHTDHETPDRSSTPSRLQSQSKPPSPSSNSATPTRSSYRGQATTGSFLQTGDSDVSHRRSRRHYQAGSSPGPSSHKPSLHLGCPSLKRNASTSSASSASPVGSAFQFQQRSPFMGRTVIDGTPEKTSESDSDTDSPVRLPQNRNKLRQIRDSPSPEIPLNLSHPSKSYKRQSKQTVNFTSTLNREESPDMFDTSQKLDANISPSDCVDKVSPQMTSRLSAGKVQSSSTVPRDSEIASVSKQITFHEITLSENKNHVNPSSHLISNDFTEDDKTIKCTDKTIKCTPNEKFSNLAKRSYVDNISAVAPRPIKKRYNNNWRNTIVPEPIVSVNIENIPHSKENTKVSANLDITKVSEFNCKVCNIEEKSDLDPAYKKSKTTKKLISTGPKHKWINCEKQDNKCTYWAHVSCLYEDGQIKNEVKKNKDLDALTYYCPTHVTFSFGGQSENTIN